MNKIFINLLSFALIGLLVTGCGDEKRTTPAYGVPGEVIWNGIKYTTVDSLERGQLGHKLGVINEVKIKYPVYSVKGYNANKEIAIEVHRPNK